MKRMKKILCALLAGAMMLTMAACQGQNTLAQQVQEYTQRVAGLDADEVMFTVNGEEVTAEFYLYWLAQDCAYWDYMSQMYYGAELDFTAEMEEGVTYSQYLQGDAQTMAASYVVLASEAQAKGLGLTAEQEAEWKQTEQDYIDQNGQETYDMLLRQYAVTEDTFKTIGTSSYLYKNLLNSLTDEEVEQFAAENDLYKAKHILLCTATQNDDGTLTLSTGSVPTNEDGTAAFEGTAEEYNAQVKAKAEALLAQLDASDDPLTLFDQLMNQYSEDTGLASFPDGYTFTSEENFVEEFKNTVYELEYDQYKLIEGTYGYHIILRKDLRSECMDNLVTTWIEEMDVQTTEAYDNLDIAAFYQAYAAYQEELLTQAGGTGETAAPETSAPVDPTQTPAAE